MQVLRYAPDAEPVVVISHRYWQQVFGGDPAILGRALAVNGAPATIVGVSGPGFTGALGVGNAADVFLPPGTTSVESGPDRRLAPRVRTDLAHQLDVIVIEPFLVTRREFHDA